MDGRVAVGGHSRARLDNACQDGGVGFESKLDPDRTRCLTVVSRTCLRKCDTRRGQGEQCP